MCGVVWKVSGLAKKRLKGGECGTEFLLRWAAEDYGGEGFRRRIRTRKMKLLGECCESAA